MKTENRISLKTKFVAYAAVIMILLTVVFILSLYFILSSHLNAELKKIVSNSFFIYELIALLLFLLLFGIFIMNISFRPLISRLDNSENLIRRLLAAVDQSANSIVITDLKGNIIFVNSFFEKITGYTKEEAAGKNPRILKTDFHPHEYYREVWDKISNGLVWDGEFLNRRKDGSLYWEKAVLSPVRDANGSIINYVGIKYDITESKKAHEEIIKARAEAENANKAKSLFLATMSHEIRTPMNAIMGMLDLLLETDLSNDQRGYAMTINNSAEILLNLLNDILDISKIEAGGLRLESVPINLREITGNIHSLFQKSASDKGLEFQVKVDPEIPEYVLDDQVRIIQILTNLVSNAIKFTMKGFVRISLEFMNDLDDEVCVLFKVKDSGIGISTKEGRNLFKPYSQADASTARKFGGSGLGLSISKNLSIAMGGELFFISYLSAGSTFIAIIPFKKIESDFSKDEMNKDSKLNNDENSVILILIVEDNLVNIRLMEAYLSRWGFRFEAANNGIEALKLLSEKTYDVVLMDVQMPEMDGYETVKRIRQNEALTGSHVPVIAMTANALEGDRERSLAAGMDDYMSKPVNKEELLKKIKKLIKNSIIPSV